MRIYAMGSRGERYVLPLQTAIKSYKSDIEKQVLALRGKYKASIDSSALFLNKTLYDAKVSLGRKVELVLAILESPVFTTEQIFISPKLSRALLIRVLNEDLEARKIPPMPSHAQMLYPRQLRDYYLLLREATYGNQEAQKIALQGELTLGKENDNIVPSVNILQAVLKSPRIGPEQKADLALKLLASPLYFRPAGQRRSNRITCSFLLKILNADLKRRRIKNIPATKGGIKLTPAEIIEAYNAKVRD